MQDDLIERLREAGRDRSGASISNGCVDCGLSANLCDDAIAHIAALEALVKEAGEALSEYACHGGPDLPCIRSKDQCRTECGKIAGDALAKIKENTNG